MTAPKISIITVVYNGEATIRNTIQSVVYQTYSNIEFIIIDGGSGDKTVEIIEEFQMRISYWISEPDGGIYDAMNKGLKAASGDWLLFLGSDDVFMSNDVIEKAVTEFKDPQGIYYANVVWKFSNIIYPNRKIGRVRLALKNFAHQALFYPRHIYKAYEYDVKYRLFADHVYNIKLYGKYAHLFHYFPDIITLYNDAGASSHAADKSFEQDRVEIAGKFLGKIPQMYLSGRLRLGKIKRLIKKPKR